MTRFNSLKREILFLLLTSVILLDNSVSLNTSLCSVNARTDFRSCSLAFRLYPHRLRGHGVRTQNWSGLPFPYLRDLPHQGSNLSLHLLVTTGEFFALCTSRNLLQYY